MPGGQKIIQLMCWWAWIWNWAMRGSSKKLLPYFHLNKLLSLIIQRSCRDLITASRRGVTHSFICLFWIPLQARGMMLEGTGEKQQTFLTEQYLIKPHHDAVQLFKRAIALAFAFFLAFSLPAQAMDPTPNMPVNKWSTLE